MNGTSLLVSAAAMNLLAWACAWGALPALPSTSATVVFHLDASDLDGNGQYDGYNESGLTGTNQVAVWVDKGTMHADMLQTNALFRPTYVDYGLGDGRRPYVRFDGSSSTTNYMSAAAAIAGQQGTVAIVYRPRSQTTFPYCHQLFTASLPSSGTIYGSFSARATASADTDFNVSGNRDLVSTTNVVGYNQLARWIAMSDGSAWSTRYNGVDDPLTVTVGQNEGSWFGDLPTATTLMVGALDYTSFGSGPRYPFNGDIAEIIVFDAKLNSTDLAAVDNYLAQKYFQAPASSLPAANASVLMHLDASDLDANGTADGTGERTLTGTLVNAWRNKGSAKYDVFPISASNMPAYYTSGFGTNGSSRPFVRFDAANTNYLIATAKFTNNQGSVVLVYRSRSTGVMPLHHMILTASVPGYGESYGCFTAYANGGYPSVNFQSPANGNNGVNGNSAIGYDQVCRSVVSCDGTTWSLRHNGAAQTLSKLVGVNSGDWFADISSATHIAVGALPSTAYRFEGDIAEIVVYNAPLDAASLAALDAYLTRKYYNASRGTFIIVR